MLKDENKKNLKKATEKKYESTCKSCDHGHRIGIIQ
jgi:hypothetical protein